MQPGRRRVPIFRSKALEPSEEPQSFSETQNIRLRRIPRGLNPLVEWAEKESFSPPPKAEVSFPSSQRSVRHIPRQSPHDPASVGSRTLESPLRSSSAVPADAGRHRRYESLPGNRNGERNRTPDGVSRQRQTVSSSSPAGKIKEEQSPKGIFGDNQRYESEVSPLAQGRSYISSDVSRQSQPPPSSPPTGEVHEEQTSEANLRVQQASDQESLPSTRARSSASRRVSRQRQAPLTRPRVDQDQDLPSSGTVVCDDHKSEQDLTSPVLRRSMQGSRSSQHFQAQQPQTLENVGATSMSAIQPEEITTSLEKEVLGNMAPLDGHFVSTLMRGRGSVGLFEHTWKLVDHAVLRDGSSFYKMTRDDGGVQGWVPDKYARAGCPKQVMAFDDK